MVLLSTETANDGTVYGDHDGASCAMSSQHVFPCHVLYGLLSRTQWRVFDGIIFIEVDHSQHWQPLTRTNFSVTGEIGDGKIQR